MKKVRIFADVCNDSVNSRSLPYIEGYRWRTVPETKVDIGSFSQEIWYVDLPENHSFLRNMRDNCFFDEGQFNDVLK